MEYKEDVVYKIRCKNSTNWCNPYKNFHKGEFYTCKRKDGFWHTNKRFDDYNFSWSDTGFYRHFDVLEEIKPINKHIDSFATNTVTTLFLDLNGKLDLNELKVFINGEEYPKDSPKTKEVSTKWIFKDNEINFAHLCNDCLKDDFPGFIVIGDTKAYVGLIHSGKQVGVPLDYTDFDRTGSFVRYIPEYTYGIFEINKSKIGVWMKKLKQYSKNYKMWRENLNSEIRDRDRDKTGASCYEVNAF